MSTYDIVIIGGGPGGYVAAIRAAQLGKKVACVEGRGSLGGTCLNVGCIPSKALLTSSEKYADAKKHMAEHGIETGEVSIDVSAMMARKDKTVVDLTQGIEFLFKKNKVDYIQGWGSIVEAGVVDVKTEDGNVRLETQNIIIATGSEPVSLPGIEIDEKKIISSTGALSLTEVPEKMVVIGAGVIGLELGQVWSRLGAEVKVVEYLDRILPGMDAEIAKTAQRALSKRGLKFTLGRKVLEIIEKDDGLTVSMERLGKDKIEELDADVVLVAVGRRPVTKGLNLGDLGVELNEHGFIRVDDHFQTTVKGIYAIGDCVPGPMLAHKAEEDGVACVEMLACQNGHVDYGTVPGVVYTAPEVAGVGQTEEQLVEKNIPFDKGVFQFRANSRARAIGDVDGLVKVLVSQSCGKILGAHIVGPHAGDLIAELVLAMTTGASVRDVIRTCHAHPALGEAVREACMDALDRAIHA
ncbi:dihydrolipoyl dehydrogenase [Terasakiella sp. A23]|uniref:dihydrolipoyl dehydrogenase n=1 Tax=Terasakiella sp. FCG-A23 TaxID=3080561 RepID=UPI002955AA5E|nr:dihydrolipoyl dehydrogenase [Terasakiella sp. A23]MDV7339315.1 dihydrolipoyl dehydrogenase [Terasakiella sp. A23]